MPMYEYINRHMQGKKVIVIVTKMDGYKDSEKAKDDMRGVILSFFNLELRDGLTIHMTSGHELYTMHKLREFLETHPTLDGDDLNDALMEQAFYDDLDSYLHGQLLDDRSAWVDHANKRISANLDTEIMASFSDLYINADKLALRGHFVSLKDAHNRWKVAFTAVQRFAEAGMEEKAKIQRKLEEITGAHRAVTAELAALPGKVKTALEQFMSTHVGQSLAEAGGTTCLFDV